MSYLSKGLNNRLQLFPHGGGWAIFNELNFSVSKVIYDFNHALNLAKFIARKNYAALLVRNDDGDVLITISNK